MGLSRHLDRASGRHAMDFGIALVLSLTWAILSLTWAILSLTWAVRGPLFYFSQSYFSQSWPLVVNTGMATVTLAKPAERAREGSTIIEELQRHAKAGS